MEHVPTFTVLERREGDEEENLSNIPTPPTRDGGACFKALETKREEFCVPLFRFFSSSTAQKARYFLYTIFFFLIFLAIHSFHLHHLIIIIFIFSTSKLDSLVHTISLALVYFRRVIDKTPR
jgi:hypothetical protein